MLIGKSSKLFIVTVNIFYLFPSNSFGWEFIFSRVVGCIDGFHIEVSIVVLYCSLKWFCLC